MVTQGLKARDMDRAFSPCSVAIIDSWAVGPGWNDPRRWRSPRFQRVSRAGYVPLRKQRDEAKNGHVDVSPTWPWWEFSVT